jgi:hypothetical protein
MRRLTSCVAVAALLALLWPAGPRLSAAPPFAASVSPQTAVGASSITDEPWSTTIDVGSAAADRIIALAISYRSDGRGSIDSLTLGGVSGTLVVAEAFASNGGIELWRVALPTGTTANLVVTFGAADNLWINAGAFAIYGADATPAGSSSTSGSGVGDISISMTVPADGAGVLVGAYGEQAGAVTWTNATEHTDANQATFRATSAYSTTAGTATRSFDGADGEPYSIAYVTFNAGAAPATPCRLMLLGVGC